MKKLTKKEFLDCAATNGLGMREVFRNKTLEQIGQMIDEDPIDESRITRDKCEIKGQRIARIRSDGRKSYVDLKKEQTIYKYKNHLIVFGSFPATVTTQDFTLAIAYV